MTNFPPKKMEMKRNPMYPIKRIEEEEENLEDELEKLEHDRGSYRKGEKKSKEDNTESKS